MAGTWWPASLPESLSSRPMRDTASKVKVAGTWGTIPKVVLWLLHPALTWACTHLPKHAHWYVCTYAHVHRGACILVLPMLIVWFSSLRAWSWVRTLALLILELCFSPPLQTLKEGVIHCHTQCSCCHCLQRWLCLWHDIKHPSGVLWSHYSH